MSRTTWTLGPSLGLQSNGCCSNTNKSHSTYIDHFYGDREFDGSAVKFLVIERLVRHGGTPTESKELHPRRGPGLRRHDRP